MNTYFAIAAVVLAAFSAPTSAQQPPATCDEADLTTCADVTAEECYTDIDCQATNLLKCVVLDETACGLDSVCQYFNNNCVPNLEEIWYCNAITSESTCTANTRCTLDKQCKQVQASCDDASVISCGDAKVAAVGCVTELECAPTAQAVCNTAHGTNAEACNADTNCLFVSGFCTASASKWERCHNHRTEALCASDSMCNVQRECNAAPTSCDDAEAMSCGLVTQTTCAVKYECSSPVLHCMDLTSAGESTCNADVKCHWYAAGALPYFGDDASCAPRIQSLLGCGDKNENQCKTSGSLYCMWEAECGSDQLDPTDCEAKTDKTSCVAVDGCYWSEESGTWKIGDKTGTVSIPVSSECSRCIDDGRNEYLGDKQLEGTTCNAVGSTAGLGITSYGGKITFGDSTAAATGCTGGTNFSMLSDVLIGLNCTGAAFANAPSALLIAFGAVFALFNMKL